MLTEAQANEIAHKAFLKHEGYDMGFENAMPWVIAAIKAGYAAGVRQAEKEARDDARSSSTEATWRERHGEDYGSY